MGASIQRLRHHISRLPFLSFLRNRDHVVEPRGSTDEVHIQVQGVRRRLRAVR
jgi:hypothetical protein